MAEYKYETVGVFTDRRFGGNPLAVFPDARGLDAAQMQALAAEFNLSETTFVLPPNDPRHTARVRIFTPRLEMPFAGHPNVGTGYVLACRDASPPEHYTFEEIAGLVRVHILRGTDRVITGARIAAPHSLTLGDSVPAEVVAACASLDAADIVTGNHAPLFASVGAPFVIAEVADLDALSRAAYDVAAFRAAAAQHPTADGRFALHLYARTEGDPSRLRARMFAPLGGVPEDPATGSANAALAALLVSLAPGDNVELAFAIEQGVEMRRPSLIVATAAKTGEGPVSASVEGACVPVMRGVVTV